MEVFYSTAEAAVSDIKSGNRIFVHCGASTPMALLRAIFKTNVVYLFGKNLKQRARALIEISHPIHR
jgi:acyl-CoA hydrolase